MSTRKVTTGSPLAQERYMSSFEFAEKEGLKGMPVAAKAALYADPRKRSLLFFLQVMSSRRGGLEKVAADLLEMFPARLAYHAQDRHEARPQLQREGSPGHP